MRFAGGEFAAAAWLNGVVEQRGEPPVPVPSGVAVKPGCQELCAARVQLLGAEIISCVAAQLVEEDRFGSGVALTEGVYGIDCAPIASEAFSKLLLVEGR